MRQRAAGLKLFEDGRGEIGADEFFAGQHTLDSRNDVLGVRSFTEEPRRAGLQDAFAELAFALAAKDKHWRATRPADVGEKVNTAAVRKFNVDNDQVPNSPRNFRHRRGGVGGFFEFQGRKMSGK